VPPKNQWLLLAASLPGAAANSARVRLWRALQEIGAVNLRDGLALVPASPATRDRLAEIVGRIEKDGGSAWLLEMGPQSAKTEAELIRKFDRAEAYHTAVGQTLAVFRNELKKLDEGSARKRLRQIERAFETIAATDFFPGAAHAQASERLAKFRTAIDRRFSPEEPRAVAGRLVRLDRRAFRGQRWATRKRLWVDRVASAWLIRTFIDPHATFLWLDHPTDCPTDAHGFDFDGAAFTHIDDRVTFEVLATSFSLDDDPGVARIGALVHQLDVGGEPVAEAAGFEAVLAGLRESVENDDALLAGITPVLDSLYRHFARGGSAK
jgi:hypothetical protein